MCKGHTALTRQPSWKGAEARLQAQGKTRRASIQNEEHGSAEKPTTNRRKRGESQLPKLRSPARNNSKATVMTPPADRTAAASKAVKRAKAATAATEKKSATCKTRDGGYDAMATEDRTPVKHLNGAAKQKLRVSAKGPNVPRGMGNDRPGLKSQPETKSTSVSAGDIQAASVETVDEKGHTRPVPKSAKLWSRTPEGSVTQDISGGDFVHYQEIDGSEPHSLNLDTLASGTVVIGECSPPKLATICITLDDSVETIAERFCHTHGLNQSFAHKYRQFIDRSQRREIEAWERIKIQLVAAGEERVAEMKKNATSCDVNLVEVQLVGPVFAGKTPEVLEKAKKLMEVASLSVFVSEVDDRIAQGEALIVVATIFSCSKDGGLCRYVIPHVESYKAPSGDDREPWRAFSGGL